ncbi:MAG: hypothetical protein DRJ96_01380 [Thermoprotei archaeon]|nr:MAG: hypothetical protein DRJ67_02705 [Thermoprotei archaeon]RLE98342.1 MAG: hypothetical protein DRJ96_01380 [Thermoprotei archaeon]
MPPEVVVVEVRGRRGDYHVMTLLKWLGELREFLEEELGRELEVRFREEDVDYPLLIVNGKLVFEGLPGEEGYLIELIRSSAE